MGNTLTVFRGFIVASFLTGLLGGTIDLIAPSLVPVELSTAYDAYTSELPSLALIIAAGIFWVVLLAGAIASSIGMFLLKRWSRRMAWWTTLLSLPMYPPLGSVLYSGWAEMLLTVSVTLWGAVLAMAWYSELRTRFEVHGR
jgi:hypothetical protein